jgi:four helix bundle protein
MKDFRKVKAFNLAHDLALEVLRTAETFPPGKDIDVQRDFTAAGTKVAAKIASSTAFPEGKMKFKMLMIAAGNLQVFDSALTLAHERQLIDENTFGKLLSQLIDVRDELDELIEAPFRGGKKDEE